MRKVFREEPSQRKVVSEITNLLNDYSIATDGLHVDFWENGDACYIHPETPGQPRDTIKLPDPQWTAFVSGPDFDWTHYWQTVAHEVAHKVIFEWFGGINHSDGFYAVLIALCSEWDLPPGVMDSELDYHPRNYRHGKNLAAALIMNGIHRISKNVDCDSRKVFDLHECDGKPCTIHQEE